MNNKLFFGFLLIIAFAGGLGIAGLSGQRPPRDWDANDRERDAIFPMDAVLDSIGLRPGMTVADIGAGWGYMSFKLSKRVSPGGIVLAENIEQRWIDLLQSRAAARNLSNIKSILGRENDPLLPAAGVDMIFMHAVLQWIENRPGYLQTLGTALKPDGRLIIIEIENEGDDPETGVQDAGKYPTRTGYLELFRRAGFEVVTAEQKPGWRYPVFILKKKAA
jgi:ubiquinone/menaquinone biosynthesis C-methylase UbiE